MAEYNGTKKRKKVRYHFSLVFFAAVLIFGFMFYKYMSSTTLEDVLSQDRSITIPVFSGNVFDSSDDNIDAAKDNLGSDKSKANVSNPVPESEAKDKEYFDSCAFVGDSLIYGMSSYGVVPASSVYASMSMSLNKISTELINTQYGAVTVMDALKSSMPENIYILLGVGGSAFMSVSDMYSNYTSFVNELMITCPDSNVYIISLPPVTAAKESSKESPIKNSDIDLLNGKLLDYADSKGIHYLDINSYFKDENGVLPSQDAENDGFHFKFSTYEKLTDYILTHVAQ